MIDPVTTTAARAPRAPQPKSPAAGADADDAHEHALALQKAAFDYATECTAEAERERAALEALLLAQLKDEDEIMKKWIALI
jgi:hypothetical protein